MKKLTIIFTTLILLLCAGCASTQKNSEESIAGGWEESVDQEVTDELLNMFNKGVEGTQYETWKPVKFLATQVVSGMNFKFLCDNDQELVIYQDLDKNYLALNPDGSKADKIVPESTSFTWDREGFFVNQDNHEGLSIYFAEGENDGFAVGYYKGDDEFNGILNEINGNLQGTLLKANGNQEYAIVISKDGENNISMRDYEGNERVFTPMDLPEIIASVQITTEGMGQISYGFDESDIEFSDEQPFQSGYINLPEPQLIVLGAKADEGHKFVKWTLNGEDYSTEEIITVEVDKDSNFVAVFE